MKRVVRYLLISMLFVMLTACAAEANQLTTNDNNIAKETPAANIQTVTQEVESISTKPVVHEESSYQDATYEVEGRPVSLVNGVSEVEAAPGSATKIVTRYFGNEAFGDLNGDGKEDVAFLLTQDSGGSGTFFYVVAALQSKAGYQGTNAILLGDRIAPQTTVIEDGKVIVNYADRKPDEPFTTQPSVGVSKYLHIVDGKLVEVNSSSN